MRIAILVLAAALAASGCGGGTGARVQGSPMVVAAPEHARVTITIGSKTFTESRIMSEIYAQALAAAGYRVRRRPDLGDERAADAALRRGVVDAYPEYTTTALTALFDVPPGSVPRSPRRAYDLVRARYRGRRLVALPPAPLNDAQAVGVRADGATGIRAISDLEPVARRLTLAAPPECRRRTDCLVGLREAYGLRFGTFLAVEAGARYAALDRRRADAAIVFTTDGQLSRGRYRILTDDRRLFASYHPMLVIREDAARRAGSALARTVETVQRELTTETMRGLNAAVDIDGRSPRQVAREYLEAYGHLP